MNEFIWDVLDELWGGLILSALVFLPVATGVWLWHRKRDGHINWKTAGGIPHTFSAGLPSSPAP